MSFFGHPGLVKRDFFQPMVSLGVPLENGEGMKPYILVELNPNILVRDVERMSYNYNLQAFLLLHAINIDHGTP